jgi:hypothetical protein
MFINEHHSRKGRTELKFDVSTTRKNGNRPTVGVIGGIGNQLVIESQCRRLVDALGIVRFEYFLCPVINPAIADQEAKSASGQKVAMSCSEAVDSSSEADRIGFTSPITSLD